MYTNLEFTFQNYIINYFESSKTYYNLWLNKLNKWNVLMCWGDTTIAWLISTPLDTIFRLHLILSQKIYIIHSKSNIYLNHDGWACIITACLWMIQDYVLHKLLFSRGLYFRKFRESEPRKNCHYNLCLFIECKHEQNCQIKPSRISVPSPKSQKYLYAKIMPYTVLQMHHISFRSPLASYALKQIKKLKYNNYNKTLIVRNVYSSLY